MLASRQEKTLVAGLIARLGDSEPRVREAAGRALLDIGSPAVEPLVACLRQGKLRARCEACWTLGRMQDARCVAPLLEQLRATQAEVRSAACDALGELADRRAVEPLFERLVADQVAEVRWAAAGALGRLGWGYLAAVVRAALDGDLQARERFALLADGGEVRALALLEQALQAPRWETREIANGLLGEVAWPGRVEALLGGLQDPVFYVRRAACHVAGTVGDPRMVEPLVTLLGDGYVTVREAAAEALGHFGEARLAGALVGALRGEETAQQDLLQLAEEGDLRMLDSLIQRLGDLDGQVRSAARRALSLLIGSAGARSSRFLCRRCLTRFRRHTLRLNFIVVIHFPLCRCCGQAGGALADVQQVVALFDQGMSEEWVKQGEVVWVNWPRHPTPFDFDRVEVVRAEPEEVERFCLQVRSDPDPVRRGRREAIPCRVQSGCALPQASVNLLARTFRMASRW